MISRKYTTMFTQQFIAAKKAVLKFLGVEQKPSSMIKDAMCLLDNVGWTQGQYYKRDADHKHVQAFCAVGALRHVAFHEGVRFNYSPDRDRLLSKARNFVVEALGQDPNLKSTGEIIDYNDAKGRTKEDVLNLFRAAHQLAKDKGQ